MENTYPEKFDSSHLTENEKPVLTDFYTKRKIFDTFIKENNVPLFTCPGCGYPTLSTRGSFDLCSVCDWEDDDQDDPFEDDILGGPNSDLSLTENRLIIGRKLFQIAMKVNGKIIHEPEIVFFMLQRQNSHIKNLLKHVPDIVSTHHLAFSKLLNTDEILLAQLITTTL
jgi:hypothetical protein